MPIEAYDEQEQRPEEGSLLDLDGMTNFGKMTEFSHPMHVTRAFSNCITSGQREMKKGYFDSKIDRNGNVSKRYNEDTRLTFINSVETLKNVMVVDIKDEEVKKVLAHLYFQIEMKTQEAIAQEEHWYNNLHMKSREGIAHIKGSMNQDIIFFQNLVNAKVEIYRKIFEQLEIQLAKSKYLKKKEYSN